MQRRALGRDPGLTVRMAFVGAVLLAVYAAITLLLVGLVRTAPTDPRSWLASLAIAGAIFAFGSLLTFTISRYREYAADRGRRV
jgi:Zn-dependent protease with chaperone function